MPDLKNPLQKGIHIRSTGLRKDKAASQSADDVANNATAESDEHHVNIMSTSSSLIVALASDRVTAYNTLGAEGVGVIPQHPGMAHTTGGIRTELLLLLLL
jgi:hypothetical protein